MPALVLCPGSRAGRPNRSGTRDPCLSTDTVGAVCLPAEEQDFPRGSQCWVSGWGHTDPSHSESAPRARGAQGCGCRGGILSQGEAPPPPTSSSPGHRAAPAPFSSGITPGQTQGPQSPLPGSFWENHLVFSPKPRPLPPPPLLPGGPRPQQQGVCVGSTPPLRSQPPSLDGPLPLRPESTAPILGSPLWASAPPVPLRPSCCPAFPALALRPSISASASRSPQVGHAPGHGGAPAQHPALQQLLRVQRGPHAPHAVCRLPGPEGRRMPGAGGRGPGAGRAGPAAGRPADILSASGGAQASGQCAEG